uniref:Aldehyde dehydrogenase n=1 Tax=Acrobeloides nanus TaxID=290746 RepID=A0A914C6C5_9BILA
MTTTNEFSQLVDELRAAFLEEGVLRTCDDRKKQLLSLRNMLTENLDEICDALYKDLHKSKIESTIYEIDYVVGEIDQTLSDLKSWMAPKKVSRYILQATDTAFIQKEPLGTVLIIGAWNFPIQLLLCPLVGALAGGNTVVLKPSEVAKNTEQVVAKLVPKYLSPKVVRVVCADAQETGELLKNQFDHIFYTGSSIVGKIIMRAASEFLTPVTLELGGKSPVIVDEGVDLPTVARRIVWAKLLNAGQICVTPDYVLNIDFCRIITQRQFDRLSSLLKSTRGKISFGGNTDSEQFYIQPTIITDVDGEDSLMGEEIFGPILPIIQAESLEKAIDLINKRPKPLSLYVFSDEQKHVDKVLKGTSSGSVCVNDVMMQMSLDTLPFGGVGNSGMGRYHGKYTFDTFTHEKAVLHRSSGFEKLLFMRYPPYTESKLSWARRFLAKWRSPI